MEDAFSVFIASPSMPTVCFFAWRKTPEFGDYVMSPRGVDFVKLNVMDHREFAVFRIDGQIILVSFVCRTF